MPLNNSVPHGDKDEEVADTRSQPTLRTRLEIASKEKLIELIERLAADSEESAARINYLTDSNNVVKTLLRRISSIRNGKRFVSYSESWDLAAEIATIASDIRADLLPLAPAKAQTLAEKLFSLDQVIFERADDSNGSIGSELRDACVLWLDAAAAKRATESNDVTPWTELLYDYYQKNGYGIREPLLKEAHRLLADEELRLLAARFERDAVELIKHTARGDEGFYRVINPASAMGLVAESLRDPSLHERSIRIYSPEPNELQSLDIAKHYLGCGDAQGALRWLQGPWQNSSEHERLRLLDRAYALIGDTAKRIEIRRNAYQQAPSVHTYRALAELLHEDDRAELRGHACAEAMTNRDVATAAELLFELNEPRLAERLIIERAAELNGGYYGSLTALVEKARAEGCFLAATLMLRALLDAILKRAYAKAYGHGARYLRNLQEIAAHIDDYQGHPTHELYEQTLRLAHGRKTRFWARLLDHNSGGGSRVQARESDENL